MLKIKVSGSVLNQTPMDWQGNLLRMKLALNLAKKESSVVVCLPELCITGYGCEDAFFNLHTQEAAIQSLFKLLPETKGLFVSAGLPIRHKGVLFNCTAILINGEIAGFVPKKSLAGDGVHYEPRWFKAWSPNTVSEIKIMDRTYPFGDLHFDVGGIKIGFEICEEAWGANRPGVGLAGRAVDLILNPSASHFAFGKINVRKAFVTEGSRAFNVGYVYSNLLGNEAGRIIYDGGVLIADEGKLIASGPRLSFQDVQVTSAIIDVDRNRVNRGRLASYQPDFEDPGEALVQVNFSLPQSQEMNQEIEPFSWETGKNTKEEEFTRCVALGLFDFMRKSKLKGFVISLSGGIDSAAVTLLCRLALELAIQELGLANVKSKLAYLGDLKELQNIDDFSKAMIFCAYQSTSNSSQTTEKAARAIAQDAHAEFAIWDVEQIVKRYSEIAALAFGEKLSWERHDSALQNIQARTRGPAIWMMANLRQSLLLATSNRSEAAVGYATMDGDTCGGISPIGGIDKDFLKKWAHWLSEQGPDGLRAFRSFKEVFSKAPTAELRPKEKNQTDESDLMPYEILDLIERLSIRDRKGPLECFQVLRRMNLKFAEKQLKEWTSKFFKLWCQNQWKRERYAPAFHLDDESLDPKTWCRFPILSSGFESEIAELEACK